MLVRCDDCFHPNSVEKVLAEDGISQTHVPYCSPNFSMEGHSSYNQNPSQQQQEDAAAAMEMELHQQQNLGIEQCYNGNVSNENDFHLMQQMVHHEPNNQMLSRDQTNWENMSFIYHQQQVEMQNVQRQSFTTDPMTESPYPPTSDLLNMLPLLPNSSISFANASTHKSSNFLTSLGLLGDHTSAAATDGVYDPLLMPLNLPPQPPLLRDLIHSLPRGYNTHQGGIRGGSLFSAGGDDRDHGNGNCFFQDGDGRIYENGVFEFTEDLNCMAKSRDGKDTKHFATEKQRRVQLNDKFNGLKSLVPNPSKPDRASIVGDAIDYINELKRTVNELKILVDKKRCSRERNKRQIEKDDGAANGTVNLKTEENDIDEHHHQPYHGSALRSSWLHRKSKNNTEVDVRIIDDEVTIKLSQQKRINCLLFVSEVLDELQLDLHYVAGGLIGDYYSFLFNSKISEGSTVYAHAIANKLIEVVDKHYAAHVQPTSSF